ncbi:DUF6297 family protein [Micromonospora sp. CPCC 205561]|uniref:DUF6297 family protein n=1 Tax=Micromonospora sp. CPCC 205561 TaxID=3122407 RepID=UPI002FF2F823
MATTTRPATAPTARQVRARLRRSRRRHHSGSLGDTLTDVYVVVLFVGMYGWFAVDGLRGHLGSAPPARGDTTDRYWVAVALVLAGAGFVWRALRVVGPLLVTPAFQAWVVSSPLDRRAWLLPRFGWLLLGASAGAGLLGLAAAFTGGSDGTAELGWAALAGAACGAAVVSLSVTAQAARREPRWAGPLGAGLVASGVLLSLLVVLGHAIGFSLPRPPVSLTVLVGLLAPPVAVLVAARAWRRLGAVDRAALTTGTQFADAAAHLAVLLDPSMLAALVESRRWRSIGRVRSRPFRAGGRFAVLVRADVRRTFRHPGAVAGWAALLLVTYAVAVAVPSVVDVAFVVLAYLATKRLTGGLRTVSRSPGLRRSLGGHEAVLRLAHVVVPTLGAVVWYLAALPGVRPGGGAIDLLLLPGVVAAACWDATRAPLRPGGLVVVAPFTMIPIDLLRQVLRGPDLVAVLLLVQWLLR